MSLSTDVRVPVEVVEHATTVWALTLENCRRQGCDDFFGHARVEAIGAAYRAGRERGYADATAVVAADLLHQVEAVTS